MKILVTAGNTQTPIDQVRCITNIFTGRTGGAIAAEGARRGHEVMLLTSHPEIVGHLDGLKSVAYRTFDDLERLMAAEISGGAYDAVIHVAAVSDYRLEGTYALAAGARFDAATARWEGSPTLVDTSGGKVTSHHKELWLRLTPTPKLADRIRRDWSFRGVLVKFKLEVGIEEAALQKIAAGSRKQSDADFIVANTLEGMHEWATIGDRSDQFVRVPRPTLAAEILGRVEETAGLPL